MHANALQAICRHTSPPSLFPLLQAICSVWPLDYFVDCPAWCVSHQPPSQHPPQPPPVKNHPTAAGQVHGTVPGERAATTRGGGAWAAEGGG